MPGRFSLVIKFRDQILDQIRDDFNTFEPLILREEEVELLEGKYHRGRGMVIRMVGKKLSPG